MNLNYFEQRDAMRQRGKMPALVRYKPQQPPADKYANRGDVMNAGAPVETQQGQGQRSGSHGGRRGGPAISATTPALPFVSYQPPGVGASQIVNPTAGYDNRQNNDTWGGQFSWTQPAGPAFQAPAYNPPQNVPVRSNVSWLDAWQTANNPAPGYEASYYNRTYGVPGQAYQQPVGKTTGQRQLSPDQQTLVQYTQGQVNRQAWEDAWYQATHPYSPRAGQPYTGYVGPGGKTAGQRAEPTTTTPTAPDYGNGLVDTGQAAPYDYGGGYGGGGGGGGHAPAVPAPWYYGLTSWRF